MEKWFQSIKPIKVINVFLLGSWIRTSLYFLELTTDDWQGDTISGISDIIKTTETAINQLQFWMCDLSIFIAKSLNLITPQIKLV